MSESFFSQAPENLLRIRQFQQDLAVFTGGLGELMELACQRAQALTKATGAAIDMADGEEMVYTACVGANQPALGSRYKMRLSLSGQALLSEQMLYCMDSQTDPRVDRTACHQVNAVSLICVPLFANNKAIGVIKVIYPVAHAFSERDIDILKDVAELVSTAIGKLSDIHMKQAS